MLEKLRLIFSKSEPETSAGLLLAREELEAARVAAIEALRRAQVEKNGLLVEAVASGDTKTRAAVRKSLAELQAEVDELGGALAGLDTRIEQARTAEAAQAAVEDAAQRAALARQREEAASAMQRHLEAFTKAYAEFFEAGQRIEAKLGTRAIRSRLQDGDFYMRAEIQQYLTCRSPANLIGDTAMLGGYTVGEFLRDGRLIDLQEHARRQNARLGLTAPDLPRAA
jgi:hypothetical protein